MLEILKRCVFVLEILCVINFVFGVVNENSGLIGHRYKEDFLVFIPAVGLFLPPLSNHQLELSHGYLASGIS